MVFFGEYYVNFSSPGRLILPKKIRELIKGDTFILTKGYDFCLAGYDKSDWEERARDLLAVSLLSEDALDKRRFIFSSVSYVQMDTQGRFVIPKNLLTYSQLDTRAVIIGVGDHFEIWRPISWEKYAQASFVSSSSRLVEGKQK